MNWNIHDPRYDRWRLSTPDDDEREHDRLCPCHEDNDGEAAQECECDDIMGAAAEDAADARMEMMREDDG